MYLRFVALTMYVATPCLDNLSFLLSLYGSLKKKANYANCGHVPSPVCCVCVSFNTGFIASGWAWQCCQHLLTRNPKIYEEKILANVLALFKLGTFHARKS